MKPRTQDRLSQRARAVSGGRARCVRHASAIARLAALLCACATFASFGAQAAAQEHSAVTEVGGAVGASLLLDTSKAGRDSGTYGGLLTADALFGTGPLRWGGTLGLGLVTSDDDVRTRMMAPFGLSLAWYAVGAEPDASLSLGLRARAGGWAGATQGDGLTAGVFGQGGAFFDAPLGHGVGLGVHVGVHWFSRAESNVLLGLGLHLSWSPQTL